MRIGVRLAHFLFLCLLLVIILQLQKSKIKRSKESSRKIDEIFYNMEGWEEKISALIFTLNNIDTVYRKEHEKLRKSNKL